MLTEGFLDQMAAASAREALQRAGIRARRASSQGQVPIRQFSYKEKIGWKQFYFLKNKF